MDVKLGHQALRDSSTVGDSESPAAAGLHQPNSEEVTMSKLMILFVLFVSGSLYDPPRVLNHLGPEAAAIGWKIKTRRSDAIAETL